jgi:hypothetical protein
MGTNAAQVGSAVAISHPPRAAMVSARAVAATHHGPWPFLRALGRRRILPRSSMPPREGVGMADKSPRKIASKKSGKTLKEKRKDKKEKQQVRKGLGI